MIIIIYNVKTHYIRSNQCFIWFYENLNKFVKFEAARYKNHHPQIMGRHLFTLKAS